jgi:putative spermidine/putrescine transport system substrate-binding protein
MTRTTTLGAALTALATILIASPSRAQESLTVVSWGGAYQAAQDAAVYVPFEEEHGVTIRRESYSGGVAELQAQVSAGNVTWDVVDMEPTDAVRACDEGLLEVLDDLELADAPDGTSADDDFLPGSRSDCYVGAVNVSMIVAYNSDAFPAGAPATAADYFDLEAFPGPRGGYRNASRTLEFALLADGVPAGEIYDVLATAEGQDRAFAKLDTIRDNMVWWDAGAQPVQLLADREVVMSLAWNGRIFTAQQTEDQPFEILWDAQVLEGSGWVIPRGAPNLELARQFIVDSTTAEGLARTAEYIPYGPARLSSAPLVGDNPETGTAMAEHLPTAEGRTDNAVPLDAEFWATYGDTLNQRFTAWLARN